MRRFFVTGIGTGVGKTLVSAILVKALGADYWKPVQCGNLDETDTDTVLQLASNEQSTFHPERYRLKEPASPHYAAALEGVQIDIKDFTLPETNNVLIIEGAGGLMVPLSDRYLMTDLMIHLEAPVVIVSQNYLGSINHTLLTIEYLRYRNIAIAGIVFSGRPNAASEEAILNFGNIKLLGRVNDEKHINAEVVASYADTFATEFKKLMDRDELI